LDIADLFKDWIAYEQGRMMLAGLVRFAVTRPGTVAVLALLVLAYGLHAVARAGLDIFPEFAPRQVILQTEAPGLSAEQVELLVTRPIEAQIGGIIGLKTTRSESIQGLSVVTAVFREGSDVYRNRQLVAERLATMESRLPPGAGNPILVPLASSSATVRTLGLTSRSPGCEDVHPDGPSRGGWQHEGRQGSPACPPPPDLKALRDLVDFTVVPRLLGIPGVADVNVFGGEVRQLQIQIVPEALRRHGLGIDEVLAAARTATGQMGAGFVEGPNQRLTLQVMGQPITPEALGEVVLARHAGLNVLLKDVARCAMGAAPAIGAAQIGGRPGVALMVIGQYGANTLTVSRRLATVLADMGPSLRAAGVELQPDLFVPANYIERSVANLTGHLLAGAVFVVLVLFLFLYNLRTALISLVAIPLSLLGACLVLVQAGVNLNIMVLGGLAIALGEVVDDAIIDTENIYRRLRDARADATEGAAGTSLREVVYAASLEVRGSVVYATFIVGLVFVPLLTLGGVAGRLFAPLGVSYILAILLSLLVALTVTPALACLLLAGRLPEGEPPLLRWLKPRFAAWLLRVGRAPPTALVAVLLVCVALEAILPFLGGRLLPELREGHYIVHTASLPGTALVESLRVGTALTGEILRLPGVRSVSQWAGRAERGADTYGSHYSEYEVALEPLLSGAAQAAVLDGLRAVLAGFPGVASEVNTFLTERVDETISGFTAPVVVNLYGPDLDRLDGAAAAVAALLQRIPGATDVYTRSPAGTPMLQVRLLIPALARHGLRPGEVLQAVAAAYQGAVVGRGYVDNRHFDVTVILPPERRRDPAQVGALWLKNPDGVQVALKEVAEIRQVNGRYNILHRDGQRVQTVTAGVAGRDPRGFVAELKARLPREIPPAAGLLTQIAGADEERKQAVADLLLHATLVGVGVVLLMALAVGSLRHALLLLVNLPFSLAGGAVAVLLSGAMVSVGSVVGFVTLFGITVRNGIMLVSHYRHLVEVEGRPWDAHTAARGATERLPSILMTALVTALAMLPIAVDSDNPGREIMGPMAAIIVGGLLSSTVLNLLIMPAIMLRLGRFAPAGGGTTGGGTTGGGNTGADGDVG
jgi:CzcA family heavy metal efflux pump